MLPVITDIVNLSLSTGVFPDQMKYASVKPLLKKSGLHRNVLIFFRPISSLSYLSKLIEKVVATQLSNYMDENNLSEPMHSAYRSGPSTETALVCVQNNILRAIDDHKAVEFVLLDLSAAFDTINHNILLDLQKRIGVNGVVLKWFESYVRDRKQCISINGIQSPPVEVKYGVPQGSVLGPKLFTIYTSPIADIARRYGLNIHLYADDTQIYIAFETSLSTGEQVAIETIHACISEIRSWMLLNKLQLNDGKTEFLLISTPHLRKLLTTQYISIGATYVPTSLSARNLGVMFDEHMNLESHVNNVRCFCFQHLKWISDIRTADAGKMLYYYCYNIQGVGLLFHVKT